MTMNNDAPPDTDMIKNIKTAIKVRKYAHIDEINLLWKYAMGSQKVVDWRNIMAISGIVCAIIILIKYLSL